MAEAVLTGFDASSWQAGAYSGGGGFSFGIAKATEGVGFQDPAWPRHIAAILLQPIVPGAYHFSRPDLNPGTAGAYAEADWFWTVASTVGGARGMLLVNDAESAGGSLQWCQDWAGRLAWRAGGYNPWLYSYLDWLQSRGVVGSALLQQDPLWLAWPTANGGLPVSCSMQQYGLTTVPGIQGAVDANQFFGSLDHLHALTVGGGPNLAQLDDIQSVVNAIQDGLLKQTYNGTDPAGNPITMPWQISYGTSTLYKLAAQVATLVGDEEGAQQAITALGAQVQSLLQAQQAAATSATALGTKLDAVLAGLPAGAASAVQADVDAAKAELAALGKHLGVDVTTGQPS